MSDGPFCISTDSIDGACTPIETIRSSPLGSRGERGWDDAEAGMLSAEASSAICVQRLDDSRNSAIHITYRISLRSSSLREPRYPLLRVVFPFCRPGLRPTRISLQGRFPGSVKTTVRTPLVGRPTARLSKQSSDRPDRVDASTIGRQTKDRSPCPAGERGHRVGSIDSMILPQVHLRKPCYDFSFL